MEEEEDTVITLTKGQSALVVEPGGIVTVYMSDLKEGEHTAFAIGALSYALGRADRMRILSDDFVEYLKQLEREQTQASEPSDG